MAQRVAGLKIPCFACSPQMLPQLLERALKGQDLEQFAKEFEKKDGEVALYSFGGNYFGHGDYHN